MIFLTNERISGPSWVAEDVPFQLGELYVVRYMGQPTVVTVLRRTNLRVYVWWGALSDEEFNERVLFKLGKRSKFLGMWLPWAKCSPQTVLAYGLPDALGADFDFWSYQKASS
jgi:hypothetical protein